MAKFLSMVQRQPGHIGLANFAQPINDCGMLLVTDEAIVRATVVWPLLLQRLHSGPIVVDA